MRLRSILGAACLGLCLLLSGCAGEPQGPPAGSPEEAEQIRQQDAAVAAEESQL